MQTTAKAHDFQTQLNSWRGTQRAAGWTLAATFVFFATQLVMVALGREETGAIVPTASGMAVAAALLIVAKNRIRTIAARLSCDCEGKSFRGVPLHDAGQ